MRQPGIRLLLGILGALVVALLLLSVRAWQVFRDPDPVQAAVASASPESFSVPSASAPVWEPSVPAPAAPPTRTATLPSQPTPITGSTPAASTAQRSSSPARGSSSLRGVVIAVDPGHNGANGAHPAQINRLVDAGGFRKACNTTGTATNDGYSEATFTWQLAGRLAAQLTALGAQVRMTRTSNSGWGPCIDARGRFGASVRAKVGLSLHADGAPAGEYGFHVIAPALRPGYTDDILPASQRFATDTRDVLVAAGFTPSTYIGSAGLDVRSDLGTLNLADVPTVMVECGNLRNAGDAARLRSAAGQERLAAAFTAALVRFVASS